MTPSGSSQPNDTVSCSPAVEIAQAEGLSAVTLRRVAADLGVTPGLVSHYFSSAEQLITAAFRTAAVADFAEARSRVDAAATAVAKMDALMDYVLDDSSDDAGALWLEAWSLGRRNALLAAEAKELTAVWLDCIADIVRAGVADGEFHVADVDVAARRLLTMIDGLALRRSCARCRLTRRSTSRRRTSLELASRGQVHDQAVRFSRSGWCRASIVECLGSDACRRRWRGEPLRCCTGFRSTGGGGTRSCRPWLSAIG